MSARLVDQLVEAGLVTEAQARASDPGDPRVSTRRVIQNLVVNGLDERTLAGFFVAKGYGPMLQDAELRRADRALVHQMSAADAHDLCAMPLRATAAGAVVAMADPTDEHAVMALSRSLGGTVLPTVAKLSDLLRALDREYAHDGPTAAGTQEAPAHVRPPSGVVGLAQEKRGESERTQDDFAAPTSDMASTASPVWDRAFDRSTTERDVPRAPRTSRLPLPSLSHAPAVGDETESIVELDVAPVRRAASRDEAVRRACEACLEASRGAAFLALRKGVFRGWDGAGDGLTRAGIRSLWVPASNPSMLNEVLHTGKAFRGAYGETAADHLFRAAVGSHGREVVIAPVLVGARMVGVLCANEPGADTGIIEGVAQALGEAFERLIVSRKSAI